MTTVFDLPPEVVERIIVLLPPHDFVNLSLTNRFFHTIISSSVLIQYVLSLRLADLVDNPENTSLSIAERYQFAKRREESWFNLTPTHRRTVHCPFDSSGLYDLVHGVYVLGDVTRKRLHHIRLPSASSPDPTWRTFDPKDNRFMVDFGLNIDEWDLIAVVTSTKDSGSRDWHLLELSLWQFSTSKPHPLASVCNFRLHLFQPSAPGLSIEIVGDFLILVTSYSLRASTPGDTKDDHVYVYQWKSGKLKLHQQVEQGTYSGLISLSEEAFLLPNLKTNAFEVWRIGVQDNAPTELIAKFGLPDLSQGWSIRYISCRSDPNPAGRNSKPGPEAAPFAPSPDDAIILFEVHVASIQEMHMFSLFVHRSSMLRLSEVVQQSNDPIPFLDWGTPVTHILTIPRISRWITISAGQRFAMLFPIPAVNNVDASVPLLLFDFNPHTIRRVNRELARDPKYNERGTMPTMMSVLNEVESPPDSPYFEKPVTCSLSVAWVMSRELFDFGEGIVMDDSRVLGLQAISGDRAVKRIEILHFD